MLLSSVSVLVVAQSSSEIPEGLMNNPFIYPINGKICEDSTAWDVNNCYVLQKQFFSYRCLKFYVRGAFKSSRHFCVYKITEEISNSGNCIYFSTYSPATFIHLSQRLTNAWKASALKDLSVRQNHPKTACFTSSSVLKCWPPRNSFRGPNRLKSLGARSGL